MSLAPGTRLGPYEILAPLGAGGMGEVYKATDTRLNRDVAVKVLPAKTTDDADVRARFDREARAIASLGHPNICALHDVGHEFGRDFFVMELVEGQTLDRRIPKGGMSVAALLKIAIPLADAVAAAHARGITHRDLKPANVMVTAEDHVKVLDFGLAKLQGAPGALHLVDTRPAANLTTEGQIMGTVAYMSPEQAEGKPVDHRTDLFSVGVVLYEMATGTRPFTGDSALTVLASIVRDTPASVLQLNPALPGELDRVIRRCLVKDPTRRYQTAADVRNDLEELKGTIDSGPRAVDGAVLPTGSAQSRRTKFVGVAIIGALAVIAASVWIFRSMAQAAPYDSIAVLPFVNVTKDPNVEYLVDGLTESVINDLARLPALRVVPRGVAFRYKGKDTDPQTVARELNVKVVLTGRVVQRGDTLNVQAELVDADKLSQIWGDQYDRRMADLLDVQAQLTRALSAKLRPALGQTDRGRVGKRDTQDSEAYQLYLKGRYYWNRRTEDGFRKGINYFNQAIARDPAYTSAYAGLADCFSLLARYGYEAPRDTFPRASAAAGKALAIDDAFAEAHASLAYVAANYDWNWPLAEREFRRAIALSPTYATAHHWFGLYLGDMGRFDEAIRELEEAQRAEPLSPIINANLARIHYYARDFDRALALHLNGLEIDPNFGEARVRLGWSYEQKGQFAEAIAEYKRAIDQGGVRTAYGSLGHAYALAGRRQEAVAVLSQLVSAAATKYVDPYDIALIHLGLGETDQAFAAFDQAVTAHSPMLINMKVDPAFDRIRSDPRFQALIKRVGLP